MAVTIKSAKIKNKLFCDYAYEEETEHGSQSVSVSSVAPIHDDFHRRFRQLVPHLALMCEEVDDSDDLAQAMDKMESLSELSRLSEKLRKYKVTAFKITGTGDTEGIVITGQKKLATGKVVNLNTPNLKWEDEYEYASELRITVQELRDEVIEYMDGKQAPDVQGRLFEDGEEALEEVLEGDLPE